MRNIRSEYVEALRDAIAYATDRKVDVDCNGMFNEEKYLVQYEINWDELGNRRPDQAARFAENLRGISVMLCNINALNLKAIGIDDEEYEELARDYYNEIVDEMYRMIVVKNYTHILWIFNQNTF